MVAAALTPTGGFGGPEGPRRRSSPVTFGRVMLVLGVGLVVALVWMMSTRITVTDRPNTLRTTRVILPPPPPPPPPEPVVQEKPPEPVPTPIPMEQPTEAPPPEAPSEPTQGDNALTAREGAGPSNYGLARGDGSGGRIGGRPGGGDAFAAYGQLAFAEIRQAVQADRTLSRGRYTSQLLVQVDAEGRIVSIRLLRGSGDERRDAALQKALTGMVLSRRPPDGLPAMRIELNARTGA
ncbi:TonB C-terminal domain-containing protein [Caulobacter mirabilis]|uniref:TonB-dependent receptor n=1 Tax=Caulobacter mirabilis TaxID=69666 RepID=A0A2D2B2W9_9CAUL|nr:TonB C-terminal domain-containing protein [Caulobacter mirabilis]ATQ44566.1 TonB-dependent receptor [Caulobacter mirabilis]